MPTVDKSIEVNAPISRVYNLWSNFERFPDFMSHVKEVRQTAPDRTHWVVKTAGQEVEWDAKTTVEENRRVGWVAEGESRQEGVVTFDQIDAGTTRVNVHIDYELKSGMREKAAKWFGVDDNVVENDLETFKDLVEGQGTTSP